MNRQSGSQLPIPVTPKAEEPITSFLSSTPTPPPLIKQEQQQHQQSKRRSREGRSSWLFAARQRVSPIWRPSLEYMPPNITPPTPQWPLPRIPIDIHQHNNNNNIAPTPQTKWTQPRDAPLPPPPSRRNSASSSNSSSSTTTLSAPPPIPPPPPPIPPSALPPTIQTRYMNMLLSTNRIPRSHNILSNLFAFLLLVSFVTAPANFFIQSSSSQNNHYSTPLLAIDALLLALGALGTLYLALVWRSHAIWLLNRVYLPLTLNALAGFLAAVTMVATTTTTTMNDDNNNNKWAKPAVVVALVIEVVALLVGAAGCLVIERVVLGKLRREHRRQTSRMNDLVKAAQRPPFAPGSVV